MVDVVDGEVREEDGLVVGSEEEGGEGAFGVHGDAGFLKGEEGGERGGDLGGSDRLLGWEERVMGHGI